MPAVNADGAGEGGGGRGVAAEAARENFHEAFPRKRLTSRESQATVWFIWPNGSLRRTMFAAFFAAADTAWQKHRTGRISFNGHFAVARFRLLVRFTLGTRAETLQAAGQRWRTKLYVDFISIARSERDVGQNGPGP